MKIKASVDYGVRTILYLAAKGGVCSSREISEEMTIPRDYLIQLALYLRKAGLIRTRPGKMGGYELVKDPAQISIGSIVSAFDVEVDKEKEPTKSRNKKSEHATAVYKMYGQVMESLDLFMNTITVEDIMHALGTGADSRALMTRALSLESSRLIK